MQKRLFYEENGESLLDNELMENLAKNAVCKKMEVAFYP